MKENVTQVLKRYSNSLVLYWTWDESCDDCGKTLKERGHIMSTFKPIETTVDLCEKCIRRRVEGCDS